MSEVQRPRSSERLGRLATLAVMVAIAAGLLAISASPARAALGNYYGIAVFNGANHRGTQITVNSSSMSLPDVHTDAIINNSWVINEKAHPAVAFIEAGIEKGNASYLQCTETNPRAVFFYAVARNSGTYYCHSGPVVKFNTNYNDLIEYDGSGVWTVQIGSLSSSVTKAQTSENQDQAGLEETTQSGTSCGHSSDLSWFRSNNTRVSGWTDSEFGTATIHSYKPPYAAWTNEPYALRSYSNDSSC